MLSNNIPPPITLNEVDGNQSDPIPVYNEEFFNSEEFYGGLIDVYSDMLLGGNESAETTRPTHGSTNSYKGIFIFFLKIKYLGKKS